MLPQGPLHEFNVSGLRQLMSDVLGRTVGSGQVVGRSGDNLHALASLTPSAIGTGRISPVDSRRAVFPQRAPLLAEQRSISPLTADCAGTGIAIPDRRESALAKTGWTDTSRSSPVPAMRQIKMIGSGMNILSTNFTTCWFKVPGSRL